MEPHIVVPLRKEYENNHLLLMELSIVIPVFNKDKNIVALLNDIALSLQPDVHYEIIVVDDGSTDRTADVLRSCLQLNPRLRVIRHWTHQGQSAALITGVKLAKSPWIVTLDGDSQNDPKDIERLLTERNRNGVLAHNRLITGLHHIREDSIIRRLSSRIANLIRASLLRDPCPDSACGINLFPRNIFLALPRFDHMHRFLPALFNSYGCQVSPVIVNHRPRSNGNSKYNIFNHLWVGVVDILGVMWLQRRACNATGDEIKK